MDYVPQLARELGWDEAVKNLDPDETRSTAATYRLDIDKGGVKYIIHNPTRSKLSCPKDLELKYDQGKYYVFCRSAKLDKTLADEYMRISHTKEASSPDMAGQDVGQMQLALGINGVLSAAQVKLPDVGSKGKLVAALKAQVEHYSGGSPSERTVALQAAQKLEELAINEAKAKADATAAATGAVIQVNMLADYNAFIAHKEAESLKLALQMNLKEAGELRARLPTATPDDKTKLQYKLYLNDKAYKELIDQQEASASALAEAINQQESARAQQLLKTAHAASLAQAAADLKHKQEAARAAAAAKAQDARAAAELQQLNEAAQAAALKVATQLTEFKAWQATQMYEEAKPKHEDEVKSQAQQLKDQTNAASQPQGNLYLAWVAGQK